MSIPYTALMGGYYPFKRPLYEEAQKPQAPAAPAPGENSLFPQPNLMPDMLGRAGSTSGETADWYGQTMRPWSNDLSGQDVISSEPGMMSILGMSTGTAYDALGRGYDTANFDAGAAGGGLLGMLGGPLGGALGGLLGRQLDLNYPIAGSRNRVLDFGQGVKGMSRGENRAFTEARDSVMARPMPNNLTSTERGMRQASQQFGGGSTTERGHNVSTPVGSSSAGGKGAQNVSGATRNSGFGEQQFGDRGRKR